MGFDQKGAGIDDSRDLSLPLVSVVIPCFNQAQYLNESISSALDAYHGPLEIIVVDDGSTAPRTDAYLRAAEALSPAVRVISQQNAGLSSARNTGIAAANGEFLQLLDADDIIVPPKLDLQVSHFQVANGLDVSISNFLLCDDSRTIFSKHDEAIAHSALDLSDFLYKWERGFAIPIHCALFRLASLTDTPFDTSARAKEDWLFWCRLSARGARMAYVNAHNAVYRQHAQSMRRSYVNMGKSWLHAAAKIDAMVSAREPAFFESAVDWFENFYRKHPAYVEEIAQLRGQTTVEASGVSSPQAAPADLHTQKLERLRAAIATMPTAAPLISVVIPAYNHFDYIDGCLLSVIKQKGVATEIICVDDRSPDARTTALLRALQGCHPNVQIVLNGENKGISRTQNEAVEQARGEYIAFVDCDDALVPGALSRIAQVLAQAQECDYLFTDRFDIDENGDEIRRADYGGYPNIVFKNDVSIKDDLLDGMVASHLKVIRRSTYLKAGGSDDAFSGIQDWELALKVAEFGRLRYLHEPLYRHRVHTRSVTSSDSVGQFRKTNIVRRQFAARWLCGGRDRVGPILRFSSETGSMPSIDELKEAWRQGRRCEMFVAADAPAPVLNFLREFNSYFDRIEWAGAEAYASLLGYVQPGVLVAHAQEQYG
ncbi:glycosyl transferase family 2 [Burkholderia ubonensis]|uniref:glycosyltransferase family 2 protein n=1 Tax=Burkholderia ubonensis TaxID=101571 RepID=UPI00075B4DEA|nr:glycosyltransferase family 2 protein [Burkholderia ubonensis]KVP97592.1 glycosyl transferase family 2 [Burkholderia ubonensis]KVT24763.1 glycosyl transferase family 2 [Burkholderia ubonensis]KVU29379.1 glycosyl transferase family 2 [Burkholderia ubonensis]KVW23790.1 glycosyl transferase family 2 [Burkholderia ubonensis]KVW70359.1 glycosyl transferase family 2 [Burkholderia ubonensis]